MAHDLTDHESSRRRFIRKAVYIAPGILTLSLTPSYAKAGSDRGKDSHKGETDKKKKHNDK